MGGTAERSFLLPDLDATRALAGRLAASLAPGSVVLLEGDLGAGKSELARAVIRSLAGADIPVPSPTFTLVQTYELPRLEVGHSDLYRLADESEVVELGLDECWRKGALLVEWPDRAPWLWPEERLTIRLEAVPEAGATVRRVHLLGTGRWIDLLPHLAGEESSR
ncbi:tRNA (adenosine(37)-N6)-threonylcarbamoyltransferase complex ATPase subunit type 1 TsaE [Benzoatithermus flavus]|uniref:tRNA threonylcarbamoyladenosine biosynthesis protein TsaE n=1 Tax=Benzoatithermus flavus TaxID=3108223 RepID=A0ABU8XLI0_9PROT